MPSTPEGFVSQQVVTDDGFFILFDLPGKPGVRYTYAGSLAFWSDTATDTLFIFDHVVYDRRNVRDAVETLEKQLGVIVTDPISRYGELGVDRNDSKDDGGPRPQHAGLWQPATEALIGSLLGCSEQESGLDDIEFLRCGPGRDSQCVARGPAPPGAGRIRRVSGDKATPRDVDRCKRRVYNVAAAACGGRCDPVGLPSNPCAGVTCDTPNPCLEGRTVGSGNVCTCRFDALSGPACALQLPPLPCKNFQCVDGECQEFDLFGSPGSCDDGNVCTVGDFCDAGECLAGTPITDCDDGDPCTENDFCSGHLCAGTPIDCDDGLFCNGEETCADGTCVPGDKPCPNQGCDETNDACAGCQSNADCTDTICKVSICSNGKCVQSSRCNDGDPCTVDTCDQSDGSCSFVPFEDVHSCSDNGCFVSASNIPPMLFVNDDDDNGNGIADYLDVGPAIQEDDLKQMTLTTSGCPPDIFATQCALHPDDPIWWDISLNEYATATKGGLDFTVLPNGTIFVEGSPSSFGNSLCAWPLMFYHHQHFAGQGWICHCDEFLGTVPMVNLQSLLWQTFNPANHDLDACQNNGGTRIFPGKLTHNDTNAALRRQVNLVATIVPPISGVLVYFKVFDVDDPFDQIHGPGGLNDIANVSIIDGDTVGPDNRPAQEASQAFTATTDADGKATVTFTVSMQPGNNYRAAASVLQDAMTQTTIYNGQTVNPQQHADALSVTTNSSGSIIANGDWSGYSVPLHWSQMLTVWRRLHVEVDSMSGPDFTNTLTGTIPEAPTFDAATGFAWIPVNPLPDDFKNTDQHRVGRIFILTYGNFSTDRTDIGSGTPRVRIRNAPPNIINAAGLNYTLWDDDGGSDPTENPPYVMVGFDAPPVTLPQVPDTSLMAGVYANAYVDVAPPDMQYYDTNTPFDRNVRNNTEAVIKGNFNRDLTSEASFWAVHITSGFQGYVAKDNDPDTEQAVQGLQYGVTGDSTPFLGPQRRAGSLVHMEIIRDDKRGIVGPMLVLEQYTVVHESGHQFLLEHVDGYSPPGDDVNPGGDYIMTNVLDQTGLAPNVAFSAVSLKKLRSSAYPPQGE